MAGITVNAVFIACPETGSIGGSGTACYPAAGTVAADAEVAGAIKVLLGNRSSGIFRVIPLLLLEVASQAS